MTHPLTNKLVADELQRAAKAAAGIPEPGQENSGRFADTFRYNLMLSHCMKGLIEPNYLQV